MALNHAAATATLRLDGLAVCCFNKASKQWQVGFLYQQDHDVHLSVSTFDGQEVVPPTPVPRGSHVSITTDKGVRPDYENTFQGGFFSNGPVNRKVDPPPAAKKNFRWVVDMEDSSEIDHGRVRLKRPTNPLVFTTVSDAVFYNHRVTPARPHHFYVLPDGQNPNNCKPGELDRYEFGRVNDEIAGDIECEEGGAVIIKIDGNELRRLEAAPGRRYVIEMSNLRHHHAPPDSGSPKLELTDFSLYYDIVEVDRKFCMWGVPDPRRSNRVSCNIARFGSIDDLSPIID